MLIRIIFVKSVIKVKSEMCICNEKCQYGEGEEYSHSSGFNLEGCGDVKHVPGYITCQQNLYDIYKRKCSSN